jgi:sec-independent protein translocase protein TatB
VFDIGFSELVVIGIVALIVLGPKRLPEVARAAGRWAARIRGFVESVKRDMDTELRKEDLAELRKVTQEISETRQMFEHTASSALAGIQEIKPPGTSASDYLLPSAPDQTGGEAPAAAAESQPEPKAKTRRVKPSGSGTKPKTKTPTTTAASRARHGRARRKSR